MERTMTTLTDEKLREIWNGTPGFGRTPCFDTRVGDFARAVRDAAFREAAAVAEQCNDDGQPAYATTKILALISTQEK